MLDRDNPGNLTMKHHRRRQQMKFTKLFLAFVCTLVFAGTMTAATTPTTGTYTIDFTITLASTVPTSDEIGCTLELEVTGDKVGTIVETAGAVATRSGSTATCSVKIPYSWNLNTPTTDKLYVLYAISSPVNYTTGSPLPTRASHVNVPATTVPATGSTTTLAIAATF
jgi:hypothetical protein